MGSHSNYHFSSAKRRGFHKLSGCSPAARHRRVEIRGGEEKTNGNTHPLCRRKVTSPCGTSRLNLCGACTPQNNRHHRLSLRVCGKIAAACFEGTNQKAESGCGWRPRPRGPPGKHATCARVSVRRGCHAFRRLASHIFGGHASLFTGRLSGLVTEQVLPSGPSAAANSSSY